MYNLPVRPIIQDFIGPIKAKIVKTSRNFNSNGFIVDISNTSETKESDIVRPTSTKNINKLIFKQLKECPNFLIDSIISGTTKHNNNNNNNCDSVKCETESDIEISGLESPAERNRKHIEEKKRKKDKKKEKEKRSKEKRPKEKQPKEKQPKEKQPKEKRPKEKQPKEKQPKEKQPKEKQPKEKQPKEKQPKEKQPKEKQPKEKQPKEKRPKEKQQKEKRPKEKQPEENRPEDLSVPRPEASTSSLPVKYNIYKNYPGISFVREGHSKSSTDMPLMETPHYRTKYNVPQKVAYSLPDNEDTRENNHYHYQRTWARGASRGGVGYASKQNCSEKEKQRAPVDERQR